MFRPINPRSFIDFDTAKDTNRLVQLISSMLQQNWIDWSLTCRNQHLRLLWQPCWLSYPTGSWKWFPTYSPAWCDRTFPWTVHCSNSMRSKPRPLKTSTRRFFKIINYLRRFHSEYLLTRNIDAGWYNASMLQFIWLTNIDQCFLGMIWQIFNFIVKCNRHIFFTYWRCRWW